MYGNNIAFLVRSRSEILRHQRIILPRSGHRNFIVAIHRQTLKFFNYRENSQVKIKLSFDCSQYRNKEDYLYGLNEVIARLLSRFYCYDFVNDCTKNMKRYIFTNNNRKLMKSNKPLDIIQNRQLQRYSANI